MKIGLIREGKNPPDKRVPLTPSQCKKIMGSYNQVKIYAQTSAIRCFSDDLYRGNGVEVVNSLEHCDVIMGVKEVPVDYLIDGKTFFFFSHTIKKQPYNRNLLREILKKNITLIDYEVITDKRNIRLIGFGRYAGIVGCYNGFLGYGIKTSSYNLKPANQCFDRKELEGVLKKISLPKNFKMVLTGKGRVGKGALEIINAIGIKEVSPNDYLTKEFDEPVFTILDTEHYVKRASDGGYNKSEFYSNPELYTSSFMPYAKVSEMYIPCHFWSPKSPFIFTREDARDPNFKIKMIADVSCDIDGPVASTIRPSTIANPFYGYNPKKETEVDFISPDSIGVMAVDNLPCELPKDASEDFGNEFIEKVLPFLIGDDPDQIIERATIAKEGKLFGRYSYLQDYVDGM
ncbi:MAG: NAD(P)-dependent oxidoreductase [Flavobacteriales bacterium]